MENINNKAYYIEEDEIDLRELFATIWRYKRFIAIFVLIVTILSIVYVLSKPNIYKVQAVLATKKYFKPINVEGMGIVVKATSINNVIGIAPKVAFKELLNNYIFMKNFIQKREFDKKLLSGELEKGYVFAFNYDFNIYKLFVKNFSIDIDKKTGLINISYTHPNRFFAYEVLTAFLEDGSKFLINKDLQYINSQIKKYQEELKKANNLELKSNLTKLIFDFIQQKLYLNSSKYYKVRVVTNPYIPDTKDKEGPKRALIVIVSFVTSFILAIFLVFFIEFIRNFKSEKVEEIRGANANKTI